MADKFRALLVTKDGDRQSVVVTELTDADLMNGDVDVAVEHLPRDNGQGLDHPQVPAHSRHRLGWQGAQFGGSPLPCGGSRRAERLWPRRGSSRRLCRAGPRATGLSGSLTIFPLPKPWRSAPLATPPCYACSR